MSNVSAEDRLIFARIVDQAIWQCMQNAWRDRDEPDKGDKWFKQADKLETKFKTDYGMNHHAVLNPDMVITYT